MNNSRVAVTALVLAMCLWWLAGYPRNGLVAEYIEHLPDDTTHAFTRVDDSLDRQLAPLRAIAPRARELTVTWTGWIALPRQTQLTAWVDRNRPLEMTIGGIAVGAATQEQTIDAGVHPLHAVFHADARPGSLDVVVTAMREGQEQPEVFASNRLFVRQPSPFMVWWSGTGRYVATIVSLVAFAVAAHAFFRSPWRGRAAALLTRRRVAAFYLPAGLLIAGLALRLWMLCRGGVMLESDEAAFGLLALDILQGRYFPWAFHYGQPYQGVLEAYPLALMFAVFGASPVVLKLLPLLWSLALVWLVYHIGRRLRGPLFGALAGGYLALCPVFFTFMSLKAWFGYLAVTFSGTLLVYLALVWAQRHSGRYILGAVTPPAVRSYASSNRDMLAWGLAGLLAGASFWTYPLVAPALLTAFLIILLLHPSALLRAELFGLALVCALIGLLPALAHNMLHNWETLTYLLEGGGAASQSGRRFSLVRHNLDILVGAVAPWPWGTFSLELVPKIDWGFLTMLLLLVQIARHLLRAIKTRGRVVNGLLGFYLLGLVILATHMGTRFEAEAQYLMPHYPVLALLLADVALSLGRRLPVAATLLVVLVVWLNLNSNRLVAPEMLFQPRHQQVWGQMQPADQSEVTRRLEALDVRHGIAEYWVGARLTFQARQESIYTWWWHRRFPGWPSPERHPLFEVRDAPRVGYVLHNNQHMADPISPLQTIDQALLLFGPTLLDWEYEVMGPYSVFYQRAPDRQTWRREWHVHASIHPYNTDGLHDADPIRGWSTGRPRQAGDWLQVSLPSPRAIRRAVLLHDPEGRNMTGPGRLQYSDDGKDWHDVGFFIPLLRRDELSAVRLPVSFADAVQPREAMHWRVKVDEDAQTPWEVRELFLVPGD